MPLNPWKVLLKMSLVQLITTSMDQVPDPGTRCLRLKVYLRPKRPSVLGPYGVPPLHPYMEP